MTIEIYSSSFIASYTGDDNFNQTCKHWSIQRITMMNWRTKATVIFDAKLDYENDFRRRGILSQSSSKTTYQSSHAI